MTTSLEAAISSINYHSFRDFPMQKLFQSFAKWRIPICKLLDSNQATDQVIALTDNINCIKHIQIYYIDQFYFSTLDTK